MYVELIQHNVICIVLREEKLLKSFDNATQFTKSNPFCTQHNLKQD